ncbi:MAG: hypothetical protein II008_02235 [Oscillospiraceae bacterium]|nr:hypothetical protein [Oscillospiraceae bacterium]
MPFEFPKEISRTSLDGLWNDVWRIVEQLRLWEDRLGEGSAVSVKIDESAARKQDEIMRALAAVKNAPATRIPFGKVTSDSNTAFTATVQGIDKLEDGTCAYIQNNNKKTSTNGWTLNVNGLGAKPVFLTLENAQRVRSQFEANDTYLFVYNSSRYSGGCWDMYQGMDTLSTTAYNIRRNAGSVPSDVTIYGYKICFTRHDGKMSPINTVSLNPHTNMSKALTTDSFDPFGSIYYYNSGNTGGEATATVSYLFTKYSSVDMRYSFNISSSSSPLTNPGPVYLVCDPQADGQVKLASSPIAQSLPSTADGKVYIYLGRASSSYQMALEEVHPVYQYVNGKVQLWTGA